MLIEAWSDIVCPWCYIGKRRLESALEQFEHADQVEVRWKSFELDPHAPFRRTGCMAEHLAAKYGMTVTQAEERLESLDRLAAADGLQYDLARTQGGNTFAAHRLLHLAYTKSADLGGALKEALLAAYFADLRPISEPEVLEDVAVGVGLDRDEVIDVLGSDRYAADVRAEEAEAAALGCTGVPFFVIDRAFAISGAQDVDTFLLTLQRAWERANPIETVGGPAGACGPDGCPI